MKPKLVMSRKRNSKGQFIRDTWTEEQIRVLIEKYPHCNGRDIAISIGRSYSAVLNKAWGLNLKKSPEFLKEIGCRLAESEAGIAARFKPGLTPKNKGKKQFEYMSAEKIEKTKATRFKPGHKPHNTKYDNAISIRTDKSGIAYKCIRIKESKWKLLHRHVWEKAYGEIQDGHNIVFKDGDSMNCALENLECVSNKELMLRNTLHQWPKDVQEIIMLRNQLNKNLKNVKK